MTSKSIHKPALPAHPAGSVPSEVFDRHVALLGMTGSGKTSVAKRCIVEEDLAAGRRVIIIDPTSAWWGLRLDRSGKTGGYPVYVFGGEHGDYPLHASNAEILAEAFATSSDSAIFDTSQMTVSERTSFFTGFSEAFLRRNKGWVRLVIDEAHLFMPQQGARAGGGVPRMLHAGNSLVSLGRSRGLRVVLISQRPAKIHKDSLTQVHALIALQLMSPQDRKAISDWVSDQADPAKGKEIIASLPSLEPGEAWIWSPRTKYLELIRAPMPMTFDSSRAPEDGGVDTPSLSPINLDALKGRLAHVESERSANDPAALKAEIANLRKRIKEAGPADPGAIEKAQRIAYRRGQEDAYMTGYVDGWSQALMAARSAIENIALPSGVRLEIVEAEPLPSTETIAEAKPAPATETVARKAGHSGLTRGACKLLEAFERFAPRALTSRQAARLAGQSIRSSAFRPNMKALLDAGAIRPLGRGYVATAQSSLPPMPPGEMLEMWCSRFPPATARMLREIVSGGSLTRDRIAEASGVSLTSSGLGSGLRDLIVNGLIERRGDRYFAADLFLQGDTA